MKIELDDDDKVKLSRDLQIYAYQSLKEETDLDNYFKFHLEKEIKNLFESEKDQMENILKDSVKEFFLEKLKNRF